MRFQKIASWPGVTRTQEKIFDLQAVDGKAYLAMGTNGLCVVDNVNLAAPKILSRLALPGNFTQIKYITTNLFGLCSGTNGLSFVDVSNPNKPAVISSYKTGDEFKGFCSLASNVFIAAGKAGVFALDIAHPASPIRVGAQATPGTCEDVAASNSQLGFPSSSHCLYIADGTNGLLLKAYTNVATWGTGIVAAAPGGNSVSVKTWGRALYEMDFIANQTALFGYLQGAAPLLRTFNFRATKLATFGFDFLSGGALGAYLFSDDGSIYQLSHLNSFPLAAKLSAPEIGYSYDWDGTNDFFATPSGLEIFKSGQPLGILPFGGSSSQLSVGGDRLYVGDGGLGVRTFRFNESTGTLVEIGSINAGAKRGFDLSASNVLVASVNSFQIMDFSDPVAPKLISDPGSLITLPTGQFLLPRSVRVQNNKAFLSTDNSIFAVFDIADAANPRLLQTSSVGPFKDMQIAGGNLFAADGGIRSFAINADQSLTALQQITSSGPASALKVVGTNAFLCDGAFGLRIFDVSKPAQMAQVAVYDTSGSAVGLDVQDSIAYVADTLGGLVALDVSNPAKPTLITNLVTSAPALDVKAGANSVFVALGADGVAVWKKSVLAKQTITFAPIADVSEVDDPFPIFASASSGLPVKFSIENGPATLSGAYVTPKSAGTVDVRAIQDGNANFAPAFADRIFTIRSLNSAVGPWVQARYPNLSPELWDAAADPDGDGLTNLGEYFFNTDPGNSASIIGRPTASILEFAGDLYLIFHYQKPRTTRFPMSIQVADFREPAPLSWINYPVDFGAGDSGDFVWPISNDGSFPLIRFVIQYP